MSADPRIDEARAFIRELADYFVKGGRAKVEPFLAGLESDLANAWTVPINRQEQFFNRMELQARALPELGRLVVINTTRAAFVRMVVTAIRFAVRVAL